MTRIVSVLSPWEHLAPRCDGMAVVLVRMKRVLSLSSIQELCHRTESVYMYLIESIIDCFICCDSRARLLVLISLLTCRIYAFRYMDT